MFGIFVTGYVLHLGLGLLVAATLWLSGFGTVAVLDRRGTMSPDERVGFGYPIGLLVTVVAAFAALLHWTGAVLGGLLLAVAILRGVAALPELRRRVPSLLSAVCWTLPAVAAVALIIGLLNRGPSTSLGATGLSDVIWWAERIANIAATPYPPHDHVGEGMRYGYAQQGFAAIGARLSTLPGFDPFLFNAVGGQMVFGVNLAITLALLRSGADPLPLTGAACIAALLLGGPVHPSWTVQSVVVVLTYPLFAVAYRAAAAGLPGLGSGLMIAGATIVATFASKLFALVLLAPPLGLRLWHAMRAHLAPGMRVMVVVIGGGGMLAYVGLMVWNNRFSVSEFGILHVPLLSPYWRWQDGRETALRAVALTIRDIGGLALIGFAWRHGTGWLRWLVPLGVIGFWLWYSAMPISLTGAAVLAAFDLTAKPDQPRRAWLLAGIAGVCLSAHGIMVEYNGPATTTGLVLAQLAAMLAPLAPARPMMRAVAGLAGAATVAACVLLLVADRWFLSTVARNWPMPLSPAQYDMWHRVTGLVPGTGLVFTDQTGENLTSLEAMNYYPAFSGRQIYLSGWYATPLRSDAAQRMRLQVRNAAVLNGTLPPSEIPLSRAYDGFFAVIRVDRSAPPGATLLYRNDELALYALAPR